jgi:hypothetical protein
MEKQETSWLDLREGSNNQTRFNRTATTADPPIARAAPANIGCFLTNPPKRECGHSTHWEANQGLQLDLPTNIRHPTGS